MNVEETLRELGVKPVKGQHFLNSEFIVEALVEAGEIEDDQSVLEIGPGTGVITDKLLEKAEKVYAVENDTVLSEHLEDRFQDSNIEIVNQDFMEYEMQEVDRCVANLPFQISSDAIEKLGEHQVQSALIVQKELAEKLVADPGDSDFGPTTVMANYYFLPVKLRDVSSRYYTPEPEVETSIVKLYPNRERHGVEDEEFFFHVSKALFTHSKKKVRNAFVDARHIFEIEKNRAKELRDELPHSEKRVFQLDIRDIADIAEFLDSKL
jgi:16S rRNA (adenine1518-N6/adenine1519-N6)-dimethyltransferase